MSRQIESVAVIGCGTMGSGISAASAAAGCKVLMLDVSTEAVERALGVVAEEHQHLVTTGTIADDLDKIADYDWICEAIIEDLDVKRELFPKLDELRADGSVISSNTSGIPLRDITEGMSDQLRRDVPLGLTRKQRRARPEVQLLPATAGVLEPIALVRDVGQEARQQRTVDRVGFGIG